MAGVPTYVYCGAKLSDALTFLRGGCVLGPLEEYDDGIYRHSPVTFSPFEDGLEWQVKFLFNSKISEVTSCVSLRNLLDIVIDINAIREDSYEIAVVRASNHAFMTTTPASIKELIPPNYRGLITFQE